MKSFTREEWSRTRAKGHTRFVVLHGLLRSGVPFGLFMAAGTYVWSLLDHSVWSPSAAATSFVIFTLTFGYLTGEGRWRRCERDYHDNAA